jgi:hypothetical protein
MKCADVSALSKAATCRRTPKRFKIGWHFFPVADIDLITPITLARSRIGDTSSSLRQEFDFP